MMANELPFRNRKDAAPYFSYNIFDLDGYLSFPVILSGTEPGCLGRAHGLPEVKSKDMA